MQTTVSTEFTPTHCRNIGHASPAPATPECDQPKDGLARSENVELLPLMGRSSRRSAVATGQASRLPRGGSVQHFLVGAAFLLAWGALWSLLMLSYQSPLKNAGVDWSVENSEALPAPRTPAPHRRTSGNAQPQVVRDSASLDGPPSCRAGMIELDGRCVLGEEIEVRLPAGRRRR